MPEGLLYMFKQYESKLFLIDIKYYIIGLNYPDLRYI